MQSPLTSLCEVLKLVKSSAESYRPQLQTNEAVTRAVLIDPVLRALGWDVANPAMVEVEKPVSSGRSSGCLDYFLVGESPIIIEAKKLGEPLENHFVQLVQYAFILKVGNIFMTDGLKWVHYTNFSATDQVPTKIIDLGLMEESELSRAAAYFVETLDAALVAPEPQKVEDKIVELERKFNDIERLVLSLANCQQIIPEVSAPVQGESASAWLLLGDNNWDAKKKKPVKLRLPNGQIIDVRSWTQVLTETCKYCLATRPQLLQHLPIADKPGRATKLISRTKPPSNLNSDSFLINEEEIYVCTNYSANDAVANAAHVIAKLGFTSSVKAAVLLSE
jgi:hypothetical protein